MAEDSFLFIGGNSDLDDGAYVNCYNISNNGKYFTSKSFLDKSKHGRGYYHLENPGN